ncbi:MAG: methylenetetrahydrofolate--tRNA-(uracil(54)-C(5))-methyltransferase (FADH(2)-oxidizing) TrmFO [Clostridia bacterium]
MNDRVTVIGAGLAGCEAAFQLAERGITVFLYEMKPQRKLPAHKSNNFCELVCSNSLRSDRLQNAVGLLKEEMRRLGSLIIRCADETRVPAGGALAVDRDGFSALVTQRIRSHPNIQIIESEIGELPKGPAIVATGPLTDGKLIESIEEALGEGLHFFDAAAPIITKESLDMDKVFCASRYERGSDYLNCAMTREEYFAFVRELVTAEAAPLHDFEFVKVFEGCMPIEIMAKRGDMTLAFGPLKPIGLSDERTGERPFAVVQLRQDDAAGTLYNIVGFQTNLKFAEQRRVFSMIPGLEHAEFMRYGVMHRNSFINSPGKLDCDYQVKAIPGLYFAGQITGVEGYVESASSGLVAGLNLAREQLGKGKLDFTRTTAIGALSHYVSGYAGKDFQPMNMNFGIMEPLINPPRNKMQRYELTSERALRILSDVIENKM